LISVVTDEIATVVIVGGTGVGEVPISFKVTGGFHCTCIAQAHALACCAQPFVGSVYSTTGYSAGLAWIDEDVTWAALCTTLACLWQVTIVPGCSADSIGGSTNKLAALATGTSDIAAFVGRVTKLASRPIAAWVDRRAIGSATIAILPFFHKAVLANGVSKHCCWHVV
jgi:hypothetical protein